MGLEPATSWATSTNQVLDYQHFMLIMHTKIRYRTTRYWNNIRDSVFSRFP